MKLEIVLNSGTLGGQTFELRTGFLTFGRGEMCSVRFDPITERIASKQHAFIEARADGFYLTDNKSTNGTIVNGSTIQSVKLKTGDIIQFGKNGLTGTIYISDQSAAISPDEFRSDQIEQFETILAQRPEPDPASSLTNIGLGNTEFANKFQNNTKLYIGIGLGIILLVPLITAVVWIMFSSVSPLTAIVSTMIAFTPALLYIIPLIWLDRYDPEPFWLLGFAFAWGALVAVIVSFLVNTTFGQIIYVATGSPDAAQILSAVFSAPVVEEASKGVGLLVLLIFFRKYFDDILDGIVYGGVIALGFATVENVLYYGDGLNKAFGSYGGSTKAIGSFLLLFSMRGILSPFAHVMFTALTGIGCGISRESHKGLIRFLAPIIGYICAMILHAVWNALGLVVTALLISSGSAEVCENIGMGGNAISLCGFLTGYIVLEIPLFLIFVAFCVYVFRRQRRIITEMLALDVARGLITSEQLRLVTSAVKSSFWATSGIIAGKFHARSRFIRAVGKLGLSYWHILRATAAQGQTASFQQNPLLRDEVKYWNSRL